MPIVTEKSDRNHGETVLPSQNALGVIGALQEGFYAVVDYSRAKGRETDLGWDLRLIFSASRLR